MVFRKQMASCEEAKNIDMVSYLSSLGYEPAKVQNIDYWYLSPLRNEKTPSFKVNRKLNRWYDHGTGKGGNLIDFAILYNNCTVGEFLNTLGSNFDIHEVHSKQEHQSEDYRIKITKIGSLQSFALQHYLYQRRIPLEVARQFCNEVNFQFLDRKYFAIGFKNNSGGYELRSLLFKGSSSPKDVTIINKRNPEISVFEGFFDFLSFISINQDTELLRTDFLVLNSISFFERALQFLKPYRVINLYLDRDRTGQNCTRKALSLGEKYKDKSELYNHYKDLNDWLMNIGKSQKLFP